MPSSTEKLLAERLKQIDAEIGALKAEKSKVKQALDIFKTQPAGQPGPPSRALLSGEPTFKEKVRIALSKDYPDGATAMQLLEYLNFHWERHVKRESLSPQLSRLKNDDKVIGYNQSKQIWYLLKNENPAEAGSSKELGEVFVAPDPVGDIFA